MGTQRCVCIMYDVRMDDTGFSHHPTPCCPSHPDTPFIHSASACFGRVSIVSTADLQLSLSLKNTLVPISPENSLPSVSSVTSRWRRTSREIAWLLLLHLLGATPPYILQRGKPSPVASAIRLIVTIETSTDFHVFLRNGTLLYMQQQLTYGATCENTLTQGNSSSERVHFVGGGSNTLKQEQK